MAKKSLWYASFRWYLRRGLEVFYRELRTTGTENIPLDKPVIFASNHTNALIDPLVISYFSPTHHYFMTRGDVFRIKPIAKIFASWRMLPIFRMKDGMDTLAKNNPIMDFVIEQLKQGQSIIIFPEGSHFGEMTVQPLKKGLVRMAFEVMDQKPDADLMVVPVGLHYSNMILLNQDVLVNFGQPVSVRDFPKEDSPQRTFNKFNEHLRRKMMELVVCIEPTALYAYKNELRRYMELQLRHIRLEEVFALQQRFIAALEAVEAAYPEKLAAQPALPEVLALLEMKELAAEYHALLPRADKDPVLFHYLKMPLYAIGVLNHLPLLLLARKILGGVKDRTFHSSVKFGLGLLALPLFVLVQTLLVWAFTNWQTALVYALLFPLTSVWLSEFAGKQNYKF